MKMGETTNYEKNTDAILNRANKYYENNKEVLREKAKNKYKELPEEEKYIKREYGKNRCHNMSKEKTTTKITRISKKYCQTSKSKKS